jgi:hypothetical protein
MGFKDRGHTKFCFKSYESSDEDEEDDDNYDENIQSKHLILNNKKRDKKKQRKYYDGKIGFKHNLNGIGYEPSAYEIEEQLKKE